MQINKKGNSSFGSKIFTSFFFSIFFLMGTLFLVFILRDFYTKITPYSWDETECRIISSKIIQASSSSSKDKLDIKYSYIYKNKNYTSSRFTNSGNEGSPENIRRWKQKYSAGTKAKCYVDPGSPKVAVINRDVQWFMLAFVLLPLVFMAIGAGGIYFSWKNKASVEAAAAVDKKKPVNQKKFLFFFFSIFFLAGCGFGWMMVGRPLVKIQQAKTWKKTPCEIVTSRIVSSKGSKSTTYKIDMAFRYEFSGVKYLGGSYDFMVGSDSGYDSKRKVIRRYPVGKKTYCYVNPEDPAEAVISREYNNPWWLAFLPGIFILVGAGGMIGQFVTKKKKGHVYSRSNVVENDFRAQSAGGEAVLKMKSSPLKNFAGVLFFAAFWNGIVSIFVTKAVKSWGSGNIEWFLSLFMIPFVLIGLVAIGGVIYCFIALFNSKVKLTISNFVPRLGEKVFIGWKINNPNGIERLQIYLKGEEVAIYQSGGKNNSKQTRKSVFEKINILDTANRDAFSNGKAQLTIPANTMHSFDAVHNKINWEIVVRGDIKRRPDLKAEYQINVIP
jgi:hypothetical protein